MVFELPLLESISRDNPFLPLFENSEREELPIRVPDDAKLYSLIRPVLNELHIATETSTDPLWYDSYINALVLGLL